MNFIDDDKKLLEECINYYDSQYYLNKYENDIITYLKYLFIYAPDDRYMELINDYVVNDVDNDELKMIYDNLCNIKSSLDKCVNKYNKIMTFNYVFNKIENKLYKIILLERQILLANDILIDDAIDKFMRKYKPDNDYNFEVIKVIRKVIPNRPTI